MVSERSKHNVDVIWHHAPRDEAISHAVEMAQCLFDYLGHSRNRQEALSSAGVKIRVYLVVEELCQSFSLACGKFAPHRNRRGHDVSSFEFDFCELSFRQGIRQSECHKVRSGALFPVGQSSAATNRHHGAYSKLEIAARMAAPGTALVPPYGVVAPASSRRFSGIRARARFS